MPELKLLVTTFCVAFCLPNKEHNSLESLNNLDDKLLNHCDDDIVNVLVYGSSKYSFSTNNKILSVTVEFLESMKRFEKPLLNSVYFPWTHDVFR